MSSQAPVTTLRQKLFLIVFGLLAFCLLLAAVEGILALSNLGNPYSYDDPFVGFAPGRDLFGMTQDAAGRAVYTTHPDKLAFFNQQSFPAEKDPAAYRVFALGGSTTAGRPYDARVAFARWLGLYLNAADPSRPYEVINAGAISYASYRVTLLMQELVRYQPDLFVVYTGHNEFLEERSYGSIIHQNPLLKALRFRLGNTRFYNLARENFRKIGTRGETETQPGALASEVDAKLDGWTGVDLYHRDEAQRQAVMQHLEFNLRRMVTIAKAHGAEVIFVLPAANLKDFSPFKSEPFQPLEPSQERALAQHLNQAAQYLEQAGEADLDLAEEEIRRALAIDAGYAETHFLHGRYLLASREYQSAEAAFRRAKNLDVAPLRALDESLEIIDRLAAAEKVPLIDLPQVLGAESQRKYGHQILGNEYFLDHVHVDIPVHSLIALEVLDLLAETGVLRLDPTWSEARQQEIYSQEMASLDRGYYAQRDLNLAKVLGWSGKLAEAQVPLERAAAEMPDHPEVRLNLGILHQRAGRLRQAAAELDRAVILAPEMPEAHFNRGVVYGGLGELPAAIESLQIAIRLRPDYAEAYYNLGVLESRNGDQAAALQALERARSLRPGAEVEREIGRVYRESGDFEAARAAFQRALALAPGDAGPLTELGITHAQQGELEAAERVLREALGVDPDHAEALYNLALVQAQQGRRKEAMAGYRAALAADPTHAESHNNLGILLAGEGQGQEAAASFRRAIEARPTYAEAHLNLGVVLDQSGQPDEALESVLQAAAIEPHNGRIQMALGSLYLARGKHPLARESFRRAQAAGQELPPGLLEQL